MRRVANYLVASILLTLLSGAIKYYNVAEKKETTQLLNHAHEVIHESYSLLTTLLDAETGQRGFVLTGDSSYLLPYETAIAIVDAKVNTLSSLTDDNPVMSDLFHRDIVPLVQQKRQELRKSLTLLQTQGQAATVAFIKNDSGKISMDHLRSALDRIRDYEDTQLNLRNNRLRTIYFINDTIHYASFFLISLVSGYALYVLLLQNRRNRELLTGLHEANRTLEQKVHDRTLELEKKNHLTEKLNKDIQENFEELESFYDALQTSSAFAEDTLREIRDLYDNAPCGYHSLAADGTLQRMNATELNWLGYTREEVVGKLKFKNLITPTSARLFDKKFQTFKQQGEIRNLEFEMQRKDGTCFPVLINATAIYNAQGEYISSRSAVIDLTERKKLELQLLDANAVLIRLNEEKNHFLGIATHDLKSPLNGVLGLINLIKMQAHNLTADQLQYLRMMEDSSINMQMLIKNLLDINRIEQGLNTVNKEYVAISALLKKQYQVFRESAQKKNISLILQDHVPDFHFHTDPEMLSRILENLISNAIKFSPSYREVAISVIRTETYIRFEVLDQGPGISKQDREKLFGKFQRLSARPTAGESSSGLGLSIVKELVNALNGNIVVESDENRGSKFIVELPL
ncbi:CHASE3 domain-containing protein [Chryseolinea lacunae]|uniref:histidine kinase n=1 Tax=Chryseolinea lacunae TaxID=2801331 RepID=A0ABS1KPV3_9BACT|nr:CHASE3 domain-containing protein [Chryseolinea lacunae]MBL0741253.1 CHASE3 domain-containing protein [Chryseolinea lacunae]